MKRLKKTLLFLWIFFSVFLNSQTIQKESDFIQFNVIKLDSFEKHKKLAALKLKIKSSQDAYFFKLAEAAIFNSEKKLIDAVASFYDAIRFAEEIKNDSLKGIAYAKLGVMYFYRDNLGKALLNFNKAFIYLPENNSDSNYVNFREKKLLIYSFLEDTTGCNANLPWVLEAANKQPSKILESSIYNTAGNCLIDANQLDSAIYFFTKSLKIRETIRQTIYIGQSYNNIGTAYFQMSNFSKALYYFQQGCEWRMKGKSPFRSVVESYINIGKTYYKLNNSSGAKLLVERAFFMADSLKNGTLKQRAAFVLKDIYFDNGNFKKAMDYQTVFYQIGDSMYSSKKKDELNNLTLDYETEQKLKQDSLKRVNAELAVKYEREKQEAISNRTTIIIALLILFLFVVAFFAFTFFKSNKQKQKQNELITEQHHLLQEKQIEINDSINYAKNIQNALLPSNFVFEKMGKEYFVYFDPKDVVSGDFYWASSITDTNNDLFIYITADCTGHGVPGAFMSLISISFLNEIINEKNIYDSAQILNALRIKIIQTLNNDRHDGLDCLVCVIDNKTNILNYSGANSRFFISHIGNQSIAEYKTDKMPVGKSPKQNESFTSSNLQLAKGDIIYSFTDGYSDQFGGPRNKKLKVKKVEEKINQVLNASLAHQEKEIKKLFCDWKGDNEQVDDVTFIAIKI